MRCQLEMSVGDAYPMQIACVKTAFSSPLGLFQFMQGAPPPATFQRLMNSVIAGLDCRTRLLCCLFGRPDCVQRDLERAPGSSRTSIFKTQAGRLDSEGQQMPDWHEGV